MPTLKQIYFVSLLVFALVSTAAAQDSITTQRSSLTITATAVDGRVRITAPSSVVQMHVEVYAASGEKLFDQEIRGGNVFDWHLQDGQAQRLVPGTYVCVVTARSISGKLTQKIGTVSVGERSASVQPAESQQLSAAQAQTIGPVEENSSWTIAAKDEPQTPTVIANDGTDGQMIRGRGALSFRIGDFFSGIDKEQMRLTEQGSLGIGTSEPKATLDVAGTIRAQRFLVAKPNRPASDIKAQATDDAGSVQPLVAGIGTQSRIAKWTDNAGTLGDSGITESNIGFVGIGTTAPGSKLVVSSNSATLPTASGIARFAEADGVQTAVFADAFGTNPIFNVRRANGTAAAPSAVQADQLLGVIGASGYGTSAYSGTRARVAFWASQNWTNAANGTYLTFNTTPDNAATPGGTERMRIDPFGNVGIGISPHGLARLQIESLTGLGGNFAVSATGGSVAAVSGFSTNGDGVAGRSVDDDGVHGNSISGAGVLGVSDTDNGVEGISNSGPGVVATSISGNLVEGYLGGAIPVRKFHITNTGTYVTGSDFAEAMPVRGGKENYEPGDVLVVSTKAPGQVEKASRPYDPRVAGIYSTRPGMLGADKNGTSRVDRDDVPVAIVGIVPTKVSVMNGRIRVGDLLTTSSTPGYAMRCTNRVKCVGATVGKALEPLASGKSVIKVLVMLR